MELKELKKEAVKKLGGGPSADQFVFFAFTIRMLLIIVVVSMIIVQMVATSVLLNVSLPLIVIIYFILIIFMIVIQLFAKVSLDRKMLLNSEGEISYDTSELNYYFNNVEDFIPFVGILFFQFLFSTWWLAAGLIVFFAIAVILVFIFPNMQSSAIVVLAMLFIPVIVLFIHKLLSYSMASFIKIENNDLRAIECIDKSKQMMKGNTMKLFLLVLSFIGWYILSILSFGAIYPFVLTYLNATIIEFYKSIKNDVNNVEIEENYENKEIELEMVNPVEQHIKFGKKRICIILTIVLSIFMFFSINYLNNKHYVDQLINNGTIDFNDNHFDAYGIEKDLISGKITKKYKKSITIGVY